MLLDSRHRPWIIAVAAFTGASTAVYIPYHVLSLNGPSGGSLVGIGFGIAGLALMVFAGLLGARRKFPALRLGRPERWMRGHLWLGLLTVPLVFFHAGFQFGGTLTLLLMILLILVTLSGLFGLVLQQILPRVMTSRVPMETVYEQIDHVLGQLLSEADTLVASVAGPLGVAPPPVPVAAAAIPSAKPATGSLARPEPLEGSGPLREFYLKQVRPFLHPGPVDGPLSDAARSASLFVPVRTLLPPALHEPLKDLEIICEERRQLATQKSLHRWLHGWLLIHIPLSYALLLLAAVHAIQSVRY